MADGTAINIQLAVSSRRHEFLLAKAKTDYGLHAFCTLGAIIASNNNYDVALHNFAWKYTNSGKRIDTAMAWQ